MYLRRVRGRGVEPFPYEKPLLNSSDDVESSESSDDSDDGDFDLNEEICEDPKHVFSVCQLGLMSLQQRYSKFERTDEHDPDVSTLRFLMLQVCRFSAFLSILGEKFEGCKERFDVCWRVLAKIGQGRLELLLLKSLPRVRVLHARDKWIKDMLVKHCAWEGLSRHDA